MNCRMLIPVVLVLLGLVLCTSPENPLANAENVRLSMNVDDQRYAVGESISCTLVIYLPDLVDSVAVDFGGIGREAFGAEDIAETLMVHYPLRDTGDTGAFAIEAIAYPHSGATLRASDTVVQIGIAPHVVDSIAGSSGRMLLDSAFWIHVRASGTGPIAYFWYKDDSSEAVANSDTLFFDSLTPGDQGLYYCVITTPFGTTTSERFELTPYREIREALMPMPDSVETEEDDSLILLVETILTNDTMLLDGDIVSSKIRIVDTTQNGSLSTPEDTLLVYVPDKEFHGADSFSYAIVVNDTLDSEVEAWVRLTVLAVNDPPVASADGPYEVTNDTILGVGAAAGVLANDTDPDLPDSTVQSTLGTRLVGEADTGSVELSDDGSFIYTPPEDYVGNAEFRYRAVDDSGALSAVCTVTITVGDRDNLAPVAKDDSYTIDEDDTLVVAADSLGVLANDSDDEQVVGLRVVDTASEHLNGELTVVGSNGAFTYVPLPGFGGTARFTYKAIDSDSSLSDSTATVTITVVPVNDAPVVEQNSGLTLDEAAGKTIAAARLSVADEDNGASEITFTLEGGPYHGDLELDGVTLAVSETFSQADIDAGLLDYVHDGSEVVSDSVELTITDGSGGEIPGVSFTISIQPVNDPPVLAANYQLSVAEGGTGTIARATLRAEDADNTDEELTFVVETVPLHGTLVLEAAALGAGDSFSQQYVNDSLLAYLHDGSNSPADSFVFDVWDNAGAAVGQTVFSIRVGEVNDPPVASALSYVIDEDQDATIVFEATDPEGDALVDWEIVTDPMLGTIAGTGPTVVYTPDGDVNGDDEFTYRAFDGSDWSATATVSITITAVNDAPAVDNKSLTTDEDTDAAVTFTGSDADGETIAGWEIVTAPVHGTLSGSGDTRTYTPDPDYFGADEFTYRASDGTAWGAPATVSITVSPVNDPPEWAQAAVDLTDLKEGVEAGFDLTTVMTGDPEGDVLTYEMVSGKGTVVASSGMWTWQPGYADAGTQTAVLSATDDGSPQESATITLNLTVADSTCNLTVSVVDGGGTTSSSPSGTDFDPGTVVTLTASADRGWKINQWGGSVSGTGESVDVTMDGDQAVTIDFDKIAAPNGVILVDSRSASGNNDGSTWPDAYTTIGAALAAAVDGDQVWVAEGTYKPTTGTDVTATMDLGDAVTVHLLGGFGGWETDSSSRDIGTYQTVLSGDLGSGFKSDNLVTATNVSGSISGFSVRGATCGIACQGMSSSQKMHISKCLFVGNVKAVSAAGDAKVSQSVFTGNGGAEGVIMMSGNTELVLENLLICGNSSTGVYGYGESALTIDLCTIADNTGTESYSGGIFFVCYTDAPLTVSHTILWNNQGGPDAGNSQVTDYGQTRSFTRCDIQDLSGSGVNLDVSSGFLGCYDSDPLFVNTGSAVGSDGEWRTADDGYALESGSPCRDDQYGWMPLSGTPDIRGVARPQNTYPDIGAYEQ